MEFKWVTLTIIYLTTLVTAVIIPKVKEDDSEASASEREILSVLKPENTYVRADFSQKQFNFQQAKQQDYLKQRYAQQQLINVEKIAEFRKNPLTKEVKELLDEPNHKFLENQEKTAYDWQPFVPKVKRRQESSSVDKQLEYFPLKIRSTRSAVTNLDNEHKVPDKSHIDRRDESEPGLGGHIIYVDPRIVKQILELKAKRAQTQSRSFNEESSEIDANSLNDLIGKNPHVQLESLKRFLQQPVQTKFLPVIGGPQPFHNKDHTPITERTVDIPNHQTRPNIQISHDLAQSLSQNNQVVTKETFERIQKQLDAASQLHVHQALEQAQQAAQAHVAAQHKAIEQAQRAILENVQKSLYESPQALRLIRPNLAEYTHPIQHQQEVYSTPLPQVHDVTIPTSKIQVNYKTALTTTVPTEIQNTIGPEVVSHSSVSQVPQFHLLRVTQVPTKVPKHFLLQPQVEHVGLTQKPVQRYHVKNVKPYAPHHMHQAVAQLQAEKVLLQQVQSHNNAIINSNKALTRFVGQKIPQHSAKEEESFEKESQQSENTYQHLVIEHQRKENRPEEEHDEENEELQYAAKYAFGYRIKDAKEGSDFGHEEKRTGRSAEGSYHVLLPDGRRQKVDYYADDNGYHAKVTYENVGHHE